MSFLSRHFSYLSCIFEAVFTRIHLGHKADARGISLERRADTSELVERTRSRIVDGCKDVMQADLFRNAKRTAFDFRPAANGPHSERSAESSRSWPGGEPRTGGFFLGAGPTDHIRALFAESERKGMQLR